MLVGKMSFLFKKVDSLETNPSYRGASNGSFGNVNVCEAYGIQGHVGY